MRPLMAVDEELPEAEPRWPMAGAVLAIAVLIALLPERISFGPRWFVPVFVVLLLTSLIAADPGRITRRSSVLRVLALTLIGLLGLSTLASTYYLIHELIIGGKVTQEPGPLLSAGASVWLSNGLAFALFYWEMDGGGPIGRLESMPRYPDFAFPQQLNPELARAAWRPRFVDYLYLSITNSVAFSPTDTMPLVHWAKLAMASQALVSFSIIGLVVARAVNAFS